MAAGYSWPSPPPHLATVLAMGDREVPLARYALLSIAAALVTMALKLAAWWLTGSVGLLSDALESGVNLAAALIALVVLVVAARPADDQHGFGHGKAEYFSSGAEGALILVAAGSIAWASVERLLDPRPLDDLGVGLAISVVAALVNLGAAVLIGRAGRARRSITLEADSKHLLTDVWTTGGVLVGVGLVAVTGWDRLDPVVGLAVAVNICWTGVRLLRRSAGGLMDEALPEAERARIDEVLARHASPEVQFHAVRTRQAGQRSFASLHVLVPGAWSVQAGHDLVERVEADLRAAVPGLTCLTHVEPLEDPASFADLDLDRQVLPPSVDEGRTRRGRPGGGSPEPPPPGAAGGG
jgi:cation diffusion facilitator family transporter